MGRLKSLFRKSSLFFYSLFFQITLFVTVIITLLALFLFFNFKNYTLSIIYKSNERALTQISYNTDALNYYIKTFALSLYVNSNSNALMNSPGLDIIDKVNHLKKVDEVYASTPFLDSIYLYNGRMDTFFAVGPNRIIRPKNNFFDEEIVSLIETADKKSITNPIARIIPKSDEFSISDCKVYTYIYFETFFDNRTKKNAVIMNVKPEWVFTYMSENWENPLAEESDLFIIDENGTVYGHTNDEFFLKNLSGEEYIMKTLSSEKTSGFFESKINGVSYIVTYVAPENQYWKYVSIVPYSSVAESVENVERITLLICVITLFLGLVAAFVLSKKMSSPIARLKDKFEQTFGSISQDYTESEITFIINNINSIGMKLKSLEAYKSKSIDSLKETYLQSIILNKSLSGADPKEDVNDLPLKIKKNVPLIVILVKIDQYSLFCDQNSKEDQRLLKFAFLNIAGEILSHQFNNEILDMGEDNIAVILNCDTPSGNIEPHSVLLKCSLEKIQMSIRQHFDVSVSFFISNVCENLFSIHTAYGNLMDLSRNRFIFGHGCILTEADTNENTGQYFEISNKEVGKFLEYLKLRELRNASESLSVIFGMFSGYQYGSIMFALSFLSFSVFKTLNLIESNDVLSFNIDYMAFNRRISTRETLAEIKDEYLNLLNEFADTLEERKEEKYNVLVENIKKYIEQNYGDCNLSTNQIASVFNLTPAYLGRIFREHTDKSIGDFILDYRLEKAKEFLLKTNWRIDKILHAVGWENKKYFFTVFKKQFGTTPTQYRLKKTITHINDE